MGQVPDWLQGPRCPKAGSWQVLVSGAASWGSWLRGPKFVRADTGLLVGGARFLGIWLEGLESPGPGGGLLVGKAGAQGILGLLSAHWLVRSSPGASAGLLVGGAGT